MDTLWWRIFHFIPSSGISFISAEADAKVDPVDLYTQATNEEEHPSLKG
jgi:hypothetical protein